MIWKVVQGKPEAVWATTATSSNAGMVKAYVIGGEIYVETDDHCQVGIFHDKFLKEAMPNIRKALHIPDPELLEKATKLARLSYVAGKRKAELRNQTEQRGKDKSDAFEKAFADALKLAMDIVKPKDKDELDNLEKVVAAALKSAMEK